MFFETLESRQMLAIVPIEGTPFWDYPGNYLPPQSYDASTTDGFLSGPAAGAPLTVALNYLTQNAAAYGLTPADLANHNVTDQYASPDLGVTHIYLEQTFNGLPVADANISVNVMTDGRILTAGANFVPGLSQALQTIAPEITPQDAVSLFASAAGISADSINITSPPSGPKQRTLISAPSISVDPIPVELHYVPSPGGGVELAWQIIARAPYVDEEPVQHEHDHDHAHWFDASVAASGPRQGSVIRVADWVANASYIVYPKPVQDPSFGGRSTVIDPWDPNASPFGWHDGNGTLAPDFTDTRGNNVFAQEDASGLVFAGLPGGFRPQGGPNLKFHFPIDFQELPSVWESAAITNLFYWNNIVHDVSFNHGFTEVAGNFQLFNYTGTGLANDPVMANNQELFDFGGLNNAFMGTPPDGLRPTMGMFVFDTSLATFQRLNFPRDSSLDAAIIVHEYTHGISNRLTGGPANANALQALQSGGMGEGWSDWLALVLTARSGDNKNTARGVGQWVSDETSTGGGIRRFPYSFDKAINPLTLNDFNGDNFPQQNNSEVHNAGEIWSTVLWDLTQILIDKYGFSSNLNNHTGGQNVAMDLVLGGMKLQPANPTFIEARDAIIAADQALTGGQNFVELWTAFARRGFGFSASAGPTSNSLEVSGTFDLPPIPITGLVINDLDGDGVRDANDGPLAGWTVYNDANNNQALDAGEPRSVTGATGTYSVLVPAGTTAHIREVVLPGWQRTAPATGVFNINVGLGQTLANFNFLNQAVSGGIRGTKFNDLDGNGQRDPGEPGIQGIVIYVDLNKDGKIGILEPAATTDANGNYTINGVPAGTDYQVREVPRPGLVQIFPDPADAATLGGAHVDVDVVSGVFTTGINFGNQLALDFGDAPNSYGTLLANNGPRHGVVTGYGLTLNVADSANVIDADGNGQPHPGALGDDSAGIDDENGVQFAAGLVPGTIGSVRVGVRTGGFSQAYLQAWIDFNRDGDFLDAGEKIVSDRQLREGIHDLTFSVPANASLGATFARFRYGFERGLGPLGAALGGEVEDHATNILQDQAIAVNDIFPDRTRVPPDDFIKLNSDFTDPANQLDVLRNDFGTSSDPTPEIVAANFTGPGQTLTTAAGGTVRFVGPSLPLQYRPKPGFTGVDSFQYQVTAGGSTSNFGTVTITVSPSDPVAVDDIFRIPAASGATDILVLANDLAALNQQISITGDPTPVSAFIPQGMSLVRSAAGDKLILNRAVGTAAATFTGTVRFAYTIDDVGDPSTASSTAVVTIQITPADTTPAASHLAIFRTRYLRADSNGDPILGSGVSTVFLADSPFFWVELVVQDPANAGDNPATIGVESAYIDMLINSFPTDPLIPVLVEPVLNAAGTRFVIEYEPAYGLVQRDDATFSVPGTVQEIGATRGSVAPPTPPPTGNGEVVVMRVKFQAHDGGSVIIQADHADSAQNSIALAIPTPPGGTPENPLQISDDQVFIHKAGVLQIVPDGAEGEFTNRDNVYDVNADTRVNQTDILLLINDLAQYGPRSLNQLAVALTGLLPPGYLDVNIDAQVNSIDILNLVNYLATRGATGQPGGGGEGEGSGAAGSMSAGAAALAAPAGESDDVSPMSALVNFLAWQQSQEADAAEGESLGSEPVASPTSHGDEEEPDSGVSTPATSGDSTGTSETSESGAVDSEAADEVFAELAPSFREQLRLRRLARG